MSMVRNASPSLFYDDNLRAAIAEGTVSSDYGYKVETDSNSTVLRLIRELDDKNDASSLRLIHLAVMISLTRYYAPYKPLEFLFSHVKAMLMAQYHFNNRMEALVPNLKALLGECNVRLTMDFYDSASSPAIATSLLADHIHRRPFPYRTTAVEGDTLSSVSAATAILNSVRRVPQVSHGSADVRLSQRDTYPYFGRTIPASTGDITAALEYATNFLGVKFLGVLYAQDNFIEVQQATFVERAIQYGITVQTVSFSWDQGKLNSSTHKVAAEDDSGQYRTIREALEILKATGFHYFTAMIFTEHFETLLKEATAAEIMGPGYVWMFTSSITVPYLMSLKYPANSREAQSLHGIGGLTLGVTNEYSGRFVEEYKRFETLEELPSYYESKTPLVTNSVNFTRDHVTGDLTNSFAPFAYDAIMALGIAACQSDRAFFSPEELLDAFLSSNFEGASGVLRISRETGSRTVNSSSYYFTATQLTEPDADGNVGVTSYRVAEYALRTLPNGSQVLGWQFLPGVKFNYSGFTTIPPPQLPPVVVDLNEVNPAIIFTFISMAAVLIFSAVAFAIWTWWYRKNRVVRSSQPIFLVGICVGVVFMGLSVLAASAHSPPASMAMANFGCMSSWWFLALGFSIAMSALFAKTWRIYKVWNGGSHFRHVRVEPRDVMSPCIIFVMGDILILSLWQGLSPLHYERRAIPNAEDQYRRSTESEGICTNMTHGMHFKWFIVALVIVNGAALLLANYQAYRARLIRTEFAESRFIGLSMGITLQGFLIALPAFVLHAHETVSYAIPSSLVLLTSASTLYLIFIPKIMAWWTCKGLTAADHSNSSGLRMEWRRMISLKVRHPDDRQQGLRVLNSSSVNPNLEEDEDENDGSANKDEQNQEKDQKYPPLELSSDSSAADELEVGKVASEPDPVQQHLSDSLAPDQPRIEKVAENEPDLSLGHPGTVLAVESDCPGVDDVRGPNESN